MILVAPSVGVELAAEFTRRTAWKRARTQSTVSTAGCGDPEWMSAPNQTRARGRINTEHKVGERRSEAEHASPEGERRRRVRRASPNRNSGPTASGATRVASPPNRPEGRCIVPDEMSEAMRAQVDALGEEIAHLRARLADAPKRMRALEERLLETKGQLAQAVAQNEKLSYTLREAREHIATLRDEVDKLTQPPSAYGVVVGKNEDGTLDILTSGRKMKVSAHPDIELEQLDRGSEVVLNESFNVVLARAPELTGEVVSVKEVMEDGVRALVVGRADEELVCELADSVRGMHLRPGDTMRLDPRSNLLLEKLPRPEVEDLLLEEVPDISYSDIGGLDDQIEQIADAVELPFLHQDLFAEHRLPAPKGILLYSPPGCGKTLIAKAVANSLAKKVASATGDEKGRSYFINIKGPELLNKYVARPSVRSASCSSGPGRRARRAG